MRYYKIDKGSGEVKQISYEEAKQYISQCYEERVCTYDDMLSMKGIIPTPFYDIKISE